MDKQNLMPQAAQPVNRITTGQLPAELGELSEEALQLHGNGVHGNGWEDDSASVLASALRLRHLGCSYDGDDAE